METYFMAYNRLDEDEQYANLSTDAKYLYGKMRDRLKLSIKNNWQDENGFYIRMTRVSMAALLHRCLPTVRKVIKELIDAGLLSEKREGLTKSNRLYVQLLPGENEIEFQCKARKTALPTKKPDFLTDRNEVAPNQSNPSQLNPTSEEIKKKHFWALKDGDIFKYGNSFWIHEQGEINPYLFGEELKNNMKELLCQIGMKPAEVSLAVAAANI